MEDAVVVIAVIVVVALALWPALRRWLARDPGQPLVDPDQNITVDPVDGLVGIYETNYHPRRLPRGRRHPAPPGTVVHRREGKSVQKDGPQ
jgi:hypothetical protein